MSGMDDVVESGPRGTARWWWAVVAALAAVTLGLATLRADPPRAPRAAAFATPTATETGTPEPNTTYELPPPPSAEPDQAVPVIAPDGPAELAAPRWTGRHDTLLLGGGVLLRLRHGNRTGRQVRHVHGAVTRFVEVRGGTVVVDHHGDHGSPGQPTGYASFVPAGGRASEEFAPVADLVAAADGATVWITDAEPTDPAARLTVRRVDPRTGSTRRRVTLPAGMYPVGEVRRGLVLRHMAESHGGVWSPATGEYAHRWTTALPQAVFGEHVVLYRPGCELRCYTVVGPDLEDRARVHAVQPPTVSPDGRYAVAYAPGEAGMRLVVHTLATGAATTLDDSHLTSRADVSYGWSRDSARLYVGIVTDPTEQTGEVAMWRRGARGLVHVSDYSAQDVAVE